MPVGGLTLVLGSAGPLLEAVARQLHAEGDAFRVLVVRGAAPSPEVAKFVIEGDPRAMDFGLSGPEYLELVRDVTRLVSIVLPTDEGERELERADLVRVAREIGEFARAGGAPGGVTVLSSLLVFGTATSMVLETQLEVGQDFSFPTEEMWAVAERMLARQAARANLHVLRVGALIGDAETSELTEGSTLREIVRRVERSPHLSEVRFQDQPLRLETTDRAARALSVLMRQERSTTVHLVDDNAPTDRRFLEWIGDRLDREFREYSAGSRGRRTSSPLESLVAFDRRFFTGWPLRFGRTEALRLVPDLLDRPWEPVLERLVLASGLDTEMLSRSEGALERPGERSSDA